MRMREKKERYKSPKINIANREVVYYIFGWKLTISKHALKFAKLPIFIKYVKN